MAAQSLVVEYLDGTKVEIRMLPFSILAAERNYGKTAKEKPYEVNLFAAYIALQQIGQETDVQFDDFVKKIADIEEKDKAEPDPTEPEASSETPSS